MTTANLRIGTGASSTYVPMPLAELARMHADGEMVLSDWQRAPRWNDAAGQAWITALLQDTVMLPMVLHQREADDGFAYSIVDGQNRARAASAFVLDRTIEVRAGDVLRETSEPDKMLKFGDFSPSQRARIGRIEVGAKVMGPDTPDVALRRAFLHINMARTLWSCEIIHSWIHIPLIAEVINPLDKEFRARVQRIRSAWGALKLRMIITWVRIAAMMSAHRLFIGGSSEAAQQWVAQQADAAPWSAPQRARFRAVVIGTLEVLEGWQREGVYYSVITIPDVAWSIDAFAEDPAANRADVVAAMVGPVREAIEAAEGIRRLWRSSPNVMSFDAMADRREWLRSFLSDALGREPVDGDAEEMTRRWDEQPSVAVPAALPTQADVDAADAVMQLDETTPVLQFTDAEREMLDRALGGAVPAPVDDIAAQP